MDIGAGRALDKQWELILLLSLFKLRIALNFFYKARQTAGAKVRSQKGNSPEYQLKSIKIIKCMKYFKVL